MHHGWWYWLFQASSCSSVTAVVVAEAGKDPTAVVAVSVSVTTFAVVELLAGCLKTFAVVVELAAGCSKTLVAVVELVAADSAG